MPTQGRDQPEGLVEHLERSLGRIASGVPAVDERGAGLPFQIVEYEAADQAREVVHSTLGLSRQALTQPSGHAVRQEIVVIARRGAPAQSWLTVLGERLLDQGEAVARGEVTGPVAPVADGSTITGFYFAAPTYWDDDLATFDGSDGKVVIVWAVPATSSEMSYVQSHGWQAFEDLLVAAQPDVTDLLRADVTGVH